MIYLHDEHIRKLGINWELLTKRIEEIVKLEAAGDCVHPLKPYLRFGPSHNRIIAMPAYVGGNIRRAGVKWIASFPDNVTYGLPRANNTIILNHPDTGEPTAFIFSGLLNAIRTAAVSGAMVKAWDRTRKMPKLKVGIIGWGPVGRLHLAMLSSLLKDRLEQITLYDLQGIDKAAIPEPLSRITKVANSWQSAYRDMDVVATCTVSSARYIDEQPKRGSLLLNVSLRDYLPHSVVQLKGIVVDDWREVCRENTDIELLHKMCGLQEQDVITLMDVLAGEKKGLERFQAEDTIFFNPMGLGVFDIGLAEYYVSQAEQRGAGILLEKPEC
ncbi:ornithine cyclodeaminase [Paenibacillus senegalensis]|uniref:ornithine cyclodeaminase n=1 Tax=Paenibacillus senegalensis TaxID=1465766 RepID=UPI00028915B4|nr:ornithine cyclodeaminase [Paenibacillus senegalensis]